MIYLLLNSIIFRQIDFSQKYIYYIFPKELKIVNENKYSKNDPFKTK